MNTTIIGTGSWGTALGVLIASNGNPVTLLTREEEVASEINSTQQNSRYLPNVTLPTNLTASTSKQDTLPNAELVLFVIPSSGFRDAATECQPFLNPNAILLSCAKGIERGTGLRMSEILAETCPNHPLAVLSGPNHAEEISRGLPAAAVLGASNLELAAKLQSTLSTNTFRAYTSDDIAGIELGGALKNVYALASGIAAGLKLGDNARAALVTRALVEMTRLGAQLGGKPETFNGLSGVGDLIVTCFSEHSRNFRVGNALASGISAQEAEEKLSMVAEGVPNTLSIYETSRNLDCRTPILDAVHAILYKNQPAPEVLKELLTRDHRTETD
ncbi:MAG: NAD(P)H-dependent glycerol-3-phosphate dehydrogenase [Verrucomicrobiota bacterium]